MTRPSPTTVIASLLLLASLGSLAAEQAQGEAPEVFEAVPTQLESPLDTAEVLLLHNSLVCSHSTGLPPTH